MSPEINLMLQQAIEAYQVGELSKAEDILEGVLNIASNQLDAMHILAVVYASQSRHFDAIELYKKVLKLNPNHASALSNLGASLNSIGQNEAALSSYEKSLNINSEIPESWFNAGNVLCELNRPEEALAYYGNAIKINSNYLQAHNNYGKTLFDLNRTLESLTYFDNALEIDESFLEAVFNKGTSFSELKRYDEAITCYDKALNLNSNYAEAWANKGYALCELKRYDEAITCYDKSITLKPNQAISWLRMGHVLSELKRYDEAITLYDKALSLKPDYAEGWANKGNILNELKRYDEAIAHYEKALLLNPNIQRAYGDLMHAKMMVGSWSGLDIGVRNISNQVLSDKKIISPFTLLSMVDDPLLHKEAAIIYGLDKYPSNSVLGPIQKHPKREKIRLAYFSADFCSHPVAFLTAELFEMHSRDYFEVFAFSLIKAPEGDPMNVRLKNGFDRFIEIQNMSDQEIAKLARELEIDIAIDLSGATKNSRTKIFSYRIAPIQVNWLGYPGTIGAEFIDYIVADRITIPEAAREFYVEKVAYLPDTFMVDDSKRLPSLKKFTRKECNLPEDKFIFCCFNNSYKFNVQTLEGWSKILNGVQDSVLWISENNLQFKSNIITEFNKRGIDKARIIFANRVDNMSDHLARLSLADLFLDTSPYNAHTTAIDSLKAGVPIVTLIGKSFASRVAASLLCAIQMQELITNTQKEYEALAINLGNSPLKLGLLKKRLAKNQFTTPLFDISRFTKNLESLYVEIFKQYEADLSRNHISIH